MNETTDKAENKAGAGVDQTRPNTGPAPVQKTPDKAPEKPPVKDIPKPSYTYPRTLSRLVYVRRRKSGPNLPVEGEFIDESIQKIGPGYSNKTILRGLEPEEEQRWLPKVIGIQNTSDNWENGTKDYWANISRHVPPSDKTGGGGLELEVGLRYKSHEDFEADEKAVRDENGTIINPKGEPINLADYIIWRYCLRYSKVANDYADINKSAKIEFYLFSKEKETKDKKVAFEVNKLASQMLYKNLSDRSWVDHMLRVLIMGDRESQVGIKDIPNMDNDEKDVLLDKYKNSNANTFLKLGNDKNLEMRAFIEVCVVMGLLERVLNTEITSREGLTLGNTTDEVVTFLLNPANNGLLGTLKAQAAIRPS